MAVVRVVVLKLLVRSDPPNDGFEILVCQYAPSSHHTQYAEISPCKIMVVQQLFKGDLVQWRELCERMLDILTEDASDVVMMGEKAFFHLDDRFTEASVY